MKRLLRSGLLVALLAIGLAVFGRPSLPVQGQSTPVDTFIWVMVTGDRIGEFHLIKSTSDGVELWRTQFGQSLAIGVDPRDQSVWAPELNDNQGNSNQVVKLDANGSVVRRIQGYRTDIIAVDPNDGSVWVGLPNEHQVVKLDADGVELLRVSGFGFPSSIAVDARDSSVWIGDGGGTAGRKIVKLDSEGQELLRRSTPGFFSNAPQQIAIDLRDGSVWYTGFHSGYVFKLSTDGTFLHQVGGFDTPVSVSVDPNNGTVWISDFSNTGPGAVVKLDQNGSELLRVSLDSPPRVVSVDPEYGDVWVGVEEALVKLSSIGTALKTLPTSGTPKAIAIAAGTSLVPIDIKPDSDPNSINCNNEKGVITVAILTTEDFEATTVDHATVTFEGASQTHVDKKSGEPRRHEEDVDGDGDVDLVFHFRLGDTNLTCDSTEGTLTGETFDGLAIEGTDAVRMVRGRGGKP